MNVFNVSLDYFVKYGLHVAFVIVERIKSIENYKNVFKIVVEIKIVDVYFDATIAHGSGKFTERFVHCENQSKVCVCLYLVQFTIWLNSFNKDNKYKNNY
jgi:hypothetical protein